MHKVTLKDYESSPSGRFADLAMAGDAVDAFIADNLTDGDAAVWESAGPAYIQAKHVWDTAGSEGIYDTVARDAEGEPFRYLGRCAAGARINLDPRKARRIFISSPFRSDSQEGLARNLALASAACLQAFREGWMPVAPHLYFPMFLPDAAPLSRWYGMQAGLMLMEGCEKVRMYRIGGILSEGQKEELRHAVMHMAIEPEIIDMNEEELLEFLQLAMTEEAKDPEMPAAADPDGEAKEE